MSNGPNEQATVGERYEHLISKFTALEAKPIPKNSKEYQTQLYSLIKQFKFIDKIIADLDLFSDNEFIEEINVNYLPFLNVNYYLGELFLNFMVDANLELSIDFKADNLKISSEYFNLYLQRLIELELLNPLQTKQLKGYSLNREEKIQQYRYQKELEGKLALVHTTEDEDIKRQLYLDHINLLTIRALHHLQMIEMEIQVLSNRPSSIEEISAPIQPNNEDRRKQTADDYTTRLETLPQNQPIQNLLSKGRVLQPFTLTRQDLKNKVFGTGQVLPSMTVEEYLDYELANGKMAQPEEPPANSDDEDEDNEDEEYRKREWDDWKDANPKGIGNTMNRG
ncbi:Type 2A phosphatase-associated protein 42 [Yamadazyma tenuis]|uniref:TAP42-like protein n=1 Tax=Candida tenuis (strain ATCC 10573 / BCRC 21748 / CBS 615 / JCM 9827 / NBRC 10315 / NRRL Y-1498 / VKM Y-70) TaxID=590646 RepID=G3BCI0_CANTC|nr:TAP42-like protein [Yamadazyma tenuis ATCC 10573]EGV60166.1 TAP42-like protein [Yamadazyma tenuis ATCC 10573]WEJ94595.1 Type 2A phosphatase-associated protein 42 [Yamadazyma tenuis]